jgi:O-methyltransferase
MPPAPPIADAYLDLVGRALLNDLHPDLGHRIVGLVGELLEAQGRKPTIPEIAGVVERMFAPGYVPADADPYAPGQWYAKIAGDPYTMTQPERVANVREAAETVIREGVPGAFVETGVWRGGLCMMMKAVLAAFGERRKVYVCDSFQGLPEITEGADAPLRLHENPLLSVSAETVRRNFDRFGLLDDDVVIVEGWFADTMPPLAAEIGDIALLRLDGDYYTSTREVIDPLYDRVAPGGFIIVDDYGCYQQARDAIHDFWTERGLKPELIQVDWTCWYWRKED